MSRDYFGYFPAKIGGTNPVRPELVEGPDDRGELGAIPQASIDQEQALARFPSFVAAIIRLIIGKKHWPILKLREMLQSNLPPASRSARLSGHLL